MKIILSDDNEAFRKSSREIGAALGINISCFDDWESAQAELDENFDEYSAVVIDGKGRLRDDSKGEDTKHLIEAIGWFREQRAKGRFIFVVVYTGFHPEMDAITNVTDQVLGVFDKQKSKFEDILSLLKAKVATLPDEKFKATLPVVHKFTHKHFSADDQKLVREVFHLIHRKSNDFIWKKNALDALRRVNEALVDTIPFSYYSAPFTLDTYLDKIKRESSNKKANKGNRALSIIEFFHNNVSYVPDPVDYTIRNIYDCASKFSAHSEETQSDYYPSTEMIIGLVYSHFGCYHWFDSIIKN